MADGCLGGKGRRERKDVRGEATAREPAGECPPTPLSAAAGRSSPARQRRDRHHTRTRGRGTGIAGGEGTEAGGAPRSPHGEAGRSASTARWDGHPDAAAGRGCPHGRGDVRPQRARVARRAPVPRVRGRGTRLNTAAPGPVCRTPLSPACDCTRCVPAASAASRGGRPLEHGLTVLVVNKPPRAGSRPGGGLKRTARRREGPALYEGRIAVCSGRPRIVISDR